jgi:hypothetical protein
MSLQFKVFNYQQMFPKGLYNITQTYHNMIKVNQIDCVCYILSDRRYCVLAARCM